MLYSPPENMIDSCRIGITLYDAMGMNHADPKHVNAARQIVRGVQIHSDNVSEMARWWARNSRHLKAQDNTPEAIYAQMMGGIVGREWLAKNNKAIIDKSSNNFHALAKAHTSDTADWVSVRYMPFFGVDEEGNWYDKNTIVHKLNEITPGVLDTHGFWLGGDAKNVGDVIGYWENGLGRYFDIALDPTHELFEEYKTAAREGRLMTSPGFIPGYLNIVSGGYISDTAIGEVSLVIADGTARGKHSGAIGVPYDEKNKLTTMLTLPGASVLTKGECKTCQPPTQISVARAQALFKACGCNYLPLFPSADSSTAEVNQRRKDKAMSAKNTLKGVIKGVAGEGSVSDFLFRLIDGVLGDELEELSDGGMDAIVKAIEAKPDDETKEVVKACAIESMTDEEKALAKAVFVKALNGIGGDADTDLKTALDTVNAENAALRQQIAEQRETIQGNDDESWFNGLVKARKANPAEREAAMKAVRDARRVDAVSKADSATGAVKIIKATYDARVPQADAIEMTEEIKASLLAKGWRVTGFDAQADKEAREKQERIKAQAQAIVASTPQGRDAIKAAKGN